MISKIMDLMEVADPDAVHAVRSFIRKELDRQLNEGFLSTIISNRSLGSYEFNHENMSRRALTNVALAYLASLEDED